MEGNGQAIADREPPQTRADFESELQNRLTEGYRPMLPEWMFSADTPIPQIYLMRDIELMMIHPMIRSYLNYFKSGIAEAEFELVCQDPLVTEFITDHATRYWNQGVPYLQGGYEYGWMGAENIYAHDQAGLMRWEELVQFSPRDTFLLTRDDKPVGVRVKNIRKSGAVDLFLASKDVPGKGLWYAHEPRYHQHYGQSQLLGAWRPWRRLAGRDGSEAVADMGMFRNAIPPTIIGYPDEDMQTAQPGVPTTTLDSQGNPRRFARDVARQMGQWFKSGSSIGMPTTQYPPELGGGPKWKVEMPKSTMNIDPIINYIKHLWDQIGHGIGVPPELLEASEGGSGYSGRKIPRQAFLMRQQRIADAFLRLFVEQVLKPLVRWNFGEVVWTIKVKSLLEQERRSEQGTNTPGAQQPGEQQDPFGSMGGGQPLGATPPPTNVQQGWGAFSLTHPALITDRIREIAMRSLAKSRAA